jgi:hypothetical protein
MALTGRIIASIYRIGPNDTKNAAGNPATQGLPNSLPSAQCTIYPVPSPGITANGVTMNSVIKLLPTGLTQPATLYYTADTLATLQTNGN